jgi:hypothetical protein
MTAAKKGYFNIVKLLHEKGVDLNKPNENLDLHVSSYLIVI